MYKTLRSGRSLLMVGEKMAVVGGTLTGLQLGTPTKMLRNGQDAQLLGRSIAKNREEAKNI
jgi:hypothetical protein